MKKLIVAISALLFSASTAYAGAKIGINVTGMEFDSAKGTEEHKGVVSNESATLGAILGSIFVEGSVLDLFSVGLEYVPYDIEGETVTNTRRDDQGAQMHIDHTSVDLSNHTSLYVLVPLGDAGAYVKAMASHVEYSVNENNNDNTTYTDDEIMGGHLSLGIEKEVGPVFVRGFVGISEYETAESESSSGNTRIKAALGDGTHAGISIGKSF